MWRAIQYVTTPVALIAFIVAVIAWVYRARIFRSQKLIEAAKQEDRAELILATLETYQIRHDNLTPAQKFELTKKVIQERANQFRTVAIVAIVLLAVASFLSLRSAFEHSAHSLGGNNSQLSDVDRILKSLSFGNIAFNAPNTMDIDKTYGIHLLLSSSKSIRELQAELQQRIHENKFLEGAEIRIAPQMEARLTGQSFEILAIKPEMQAVSAQETTQWQWDARPRQGGTQALHLTLSVILFIQNNHLSRAIRTFDRTIEVRVSWKRRSLDFMRDNWYWLGPLILIPLSTWLWRKWQERKKRGLSRISPDA